MTAAAKMPKSDGYGALNDRSAAKIACIRAMASENVLCNKPGPSINAERSFIKREILLTPVARLVECTRIRFKATRCARIGWLLQATLYDQSGRRCGGAGSGRHRAFDESRIEDWSFKSRNSHCGIMIVRNSTMRIVSLTTSKHRGYKEEVAFHYKNPQSQDTKGR